MRTLRSYLQRGLLPRPPFRGSATRYQRAQLLCAVAVRRLRESEGLDLDAIRARLEALEPPVLERWVAEQLEPGPLTTALGITLPPAASGTVPTTSSSALSSQSPRWIRVELALGVELHVREDVDGRAQELARRLQALAVDGSNALLREASRPGA